MSAIKPISVKLDEEERNALSRVAETRKRSAHFIAREAIRDFLQRAEQRQSFIAEAEAAWRDYQDDGLHITMEEFSKWVDDVQTDPDAEMPACHK